MRKGQQEIEHALQANKIDYEIKDVAASQFDKIKMRSFANDQKALPPQIVNNRQYCGVSRIKIGVSPLLRDDRRCCKICYYLFSMICTNVLLGNVVFPCAISLNHIDILFIILYVA